LTVKAIGEMESNGVRFYEAAQSETGANRAEAYKKSALNWEGAAWYYKMRFRGERVAFWCATAAAILSFAGLAVYVLFAETGG
jgi:hypothetical protein